MLMLKLTDAGHDHYCRLTMSFDNWRSSPRTPSKYRHILYISSN